MKTASLAFILLAASAASVAYADTTAGREAFRALYEEMVEIDSSPGNPHGIPRIAHSVLTHHFVDRPGHPTRDALDQVLAFFRDRLHPAAA